MNSDSIRTLLARNGVSLREVGDYIGCTGEAVRQRIGSGEVDAETASVIVWSMAAICSARADAARQACDRLEVEMAAGVRRRRTLEVAK